MLSRMQKEEPSEEVGYQAVPVPYQVEKNDKADLIDKIKPEKAAELLRHRLLGEIEENGEWIQKEAFKEFSLSEVGAWQISNLLLGVASQNTSLSKLDDNEIKMRALSIARTAQVMCVMNWVDYNIKNVSQLRFVHECLFTQTFVVLKQADGASIQELIKGTVTEQRLSAPQSQKQNPLRRMLGI